MGGRLHVGARLGRYEVLRFLSEGGMGELYLARASGIAGFEKVVALKRILPRFAASDERVRMFLDEARLAAGLQHPNIVQVFDIGTYQASYFFAMEYVHGTDASAFLSAARRAGRPLPIEAALEIVRGAAAGLHHAHEAKVVHRDVSPSNVLVAHDGAVKVTDFGVAKAAEPETDTRPGTLKGKIAYMSPEQCRGDALDRRSDLFSLGILLYELTTGARAFPGEGDFAIMDAIVNRDVAPPSSRRADYPPELEAVVMRALRRDPAERYATAQELQRDLQSFARENKLDVSALALASVLRETFGEAAIEAWRLAHGDASLAGQATASTLLEPQGEPPPAAVVPRRRPFSLALGAVALAGALAAVWWWPQAAPDAPAAAPPRPQAAIAEPPPPAPAAAPSEPAPPLAQPAAATDRPRRKRRREPPPPVAAPPAPAPVREVPWDPDSPTLPKR